tara:strand:- start:899 stop:1465 length:567 start_codon:yes stop_codon:yes gene_type:complete
MPINFNLEKIRHKYNCKNYFETGLWDPKDKTISFRKALECNFDKISSIEIRKDFIESANNIFKEYIESGICSLYNDDSVNIGKYLNNDDNKTLFFLDAHVDNVNIKNYQKRCPLFEELNAISNLKRKDNIILIDDIRYLKIKYPWDEKSYGNIIFLDEIKKNILTINNKYNFSTLNGHIEDDVLIAYI